MGPRDRALLKAAGPLAVSAICLAWYLSQRSFDFEGLRSILSRPVFWASLLGAYLAVTLLASLRWKLLLAGQSESPPGLFRLFLIHSASQCAQLLPLGTVVMDGTRVLYMVKTLRLSTAKALKTILLDRVAGLAGLLLGLAFVLLLASVGYASFLILVPWVAIGGRGRTILAISVLAHAIKIAVFLLVIRGPQAPGLAPFLDATLSTGFGLLVEAVPISWNGFGLGHLAFEFQVPGQGGDAYNAYFVGKTCMVLLGIGPLIYLKFGKGDISVTDSPALRRPTAWSQDSADS